MRRGTDEEELAAGYEEEFGCDAREGRGESEIGVEVVEDGGAGEAEVVWVDEAIFEWGWGEGGV